MAIEYNFTLDMDRSKRDNNIAYARTGDVDSITINADLVLNGAAYTPTGANAFFECVTPNGHSIRAAAEKSGSSVSVEVPSAAFQAAGVINVAYFRFESGASDNPTYVESTEPFAIVVREGISDDIDAGDYIEEWRQLADHLEAVVAEVEQKAEQAETAINEQKTEVDQLKAQAQTSIAQDTEDVSDAKDTAISNINGSQGAVDAAIEQLERKTQEAVDAAQEALDGTLATDLQNAIDRTLKLDVADMTNIPDNSSLSSFTNVGSYCCKTAAIAATIGDCPIDDSPFNMYVFSSAVPGQVMQLVVPTNIQGTSTTEWHVRFGTSSAMNPWSAIGGMPGIVPISQGGTGATTAAQARQNLGAGTSDFSGDYNDLMNKPDIPEPISTDEIDAVIEGSSGTGEQVLNLTGLSYYWTKVKAWAQSVFAKVAHTHQASDITGFTPSRAVVSNSAGGLDASTVTTSELGCLSGVESPLQDQIDTLRDSVSHGVQEFTDIISGTYQRRRIEFGRTYNLSPTIVGAIIGGSGVVTTAINCSIQFALIDSSGATIYLYNGSTQNISKIWVHWIAISG